MGKVNSLVAVVDDEAPVRTMLRRVLRVADYEVVAFASGTEFLSSLASQVPRCVVVDLHMPGLSGFDVQRTMIAAGVHIPLVMITASDDASLDAAAAKAGVVCLLRKPFASAALLDAVHAAITGPGAGI